MRSFKICSMALFLAVAFCSCAMWPSAAPVESGSPEPARPAASEADKAAPKPEAPQPKATETKSTVIKPFKGGASGQPQRSGGDADNDSSQGRGGMISLNFDNADIFEVINALSEFLDINYIIDPAIKGKVNIHTTSEVDKKQLLAILETIFEMNNISVVKQGEFYKILPAKDAQKQGVPVGVGRDTEPADSLDRMSIQIIPLKYVPSAEVIKVIKPFTSKNGEMVESAKTNIIVVFDTAANIQKILKLVSIIDSDSFEQNEVRFFKVKNANVTDLAKELEGIFTSAGIEKAAGKGVGLGIVPVERAGMVVAVSAISGLLDQVQHWVEVLDTIDKDADEQIFIYFLENGKSEEIADILTQLYGGTSSFGAGGRTTDRMGRTGTRGGMGTSMSSRGGSSSSRYSSRSSRAARDTGTQRGRTGQAGQTGRAGGGGGMIDDNIQIVTDETTNAIIVRANSQDYAKIRETIQRLDIVPRQVLIEVFIAEVLLTGGMQFGVEWSLLQNNDSLGGYKGSSKSGMFSFPEGGLNNALTGATQTGYTYLFQSDRLQAFLRAEADQNKLNTLFTPNILIADNKEAHIEVGQEVPIVTSEYVPLSTDTSTNTANTSRSVEYRNTGVILDVTPRINDKGLVAMDISQEVSNVAKQQTTAGLNSPTFNNRRAETSVVVQNGQSVVIGGIMQNVTETNDVGMPFISKVPIIKYLFGYGSDTYAKTELIIILTPHVVKNSAEAAAITEEYKAKMDTIKQLIRRDNSKAVKAYQ